MFKITLIIDAQPKTFIQPFVSGRILRRTMEYDKKFIVLLKEPEYDRIKDLDLAAEYVSEVFANQFTPDQFIDGIASHLAIDEYLRIKELVQTGKNEAFGIDPNNPNTSEADKDNNDPNA